MLDNLLDQKRKALSLPAVIPDGALLRPFGLDGFLSTYYYALAGSRVVALR